MLLVLGPPSENHCFSQTNQPTSQYTPNSFKPFWVYSVLSVEIPSNSLSSLHMLFHSLGTNMSVTTFMKSAKIHFLSHFSATLYCHDSCGNCTYHTVWLISVYLFWLQHFPLPHSASAIKSEITMPCSLNF